MGIWFKEMPEDYYNQCSFFEDDVMLWHNDKVYVMDNHRDAAWCWLQQCKDGESYNFMHIDRHYDMGDFYSEDDLKFFKSNRNMNYSTYANLMQKEERAKVMRWDNYIRLAYDLRPNWFRTNIFLTHRQGDVCETRRKNNMKIYELDTLFMYSYMYQYLLNLSEFLDGVVKGSGDLKWIVNLDLDVFFYHFDERIHTQLFSDDYIVEIGKLLQRALNKIQVLTIAISPDCLIGDDMEEKWRNGFRTIELLADKFYPLWDFPFEKVK